MMRATPISLALILALSGSLAAQKPAEKKDTPAPPDNSQPEQPKKDAKPVRTMFIGEGGSYTHPDSSASDAMETISRQQGGKGTFGEVDGGGTTNPKPKEPAPEQEGSQASAGPGEGLAPTDPVPREMLGLPPKTQPGASVVAVAANDAKPGIKGKASPKRSAEDAEDAQDRKRYSLWEGLSAPLEMPGGKVSEVSLDKASALGRKDYDSHILGAGEGPDGASQVRAGQASAALSMAEAPPSQSAEVFVNFDLDVSAKPLEEGLLASVAPLPQGGAARQGSAAGAELRPGPEENLRDALAALSQVAGFRPDTRFNSLPSRAGKISLSGWMAADRIQAAMQVPSVSRLEIQNARSSRSSTGSTSDILLGIRVPGIDPAKGIPREAEAGVKRHYNEVIARLSSQAGFRIKRTIGYQTAPGGGDLVIVAEGRVPIRSLSRLMSHRDVVKVAPAPVSGARRAAVKRSSKSGFLAFVAKRAPLLIGVTLLLLIPAIGSWFLRFVESLVPYNRS